MTLTIGFVTIRTIGYLYRYDRPPEYDWGQHASYFPKSWDARQAEWKETIPTKFRSMETITLYNMAGFQTVERKTQELIPNVKLQVCLSPPISSFVV